MSRIGGLFTALGLVLLVAAWLWWLYAYRSLDAIGCLYLPERCSAPLALTPVLSLPPYEPMLLWVGAGAAALGTILRLVARA
jgi:hypothetical protein